MPIPIPFALQHATTTTTTSPPALHEIPAALWSTSYPGSAAAAAANEAEAMFGGAAPGLAVNFTSAAGYDVAASQVGLDEFINAL
jgi:hypothetical protein